MVAPGKLAGKLSPLIVMPPPEGDVQLQVHSSVGLSREQIGSFSWEPKQKHLLLSGVLERNLKLAEESRLKLLALGDSDDHDAKVKLLEESQAASHLVRTAADLVIAAFFAEEKDKQREARRKKNADLLDRVLGDDAPPSDLDAEIGPLYASPRPVHPFHWPVEFPEVFSRPNGGFDAFVGNPPFAGKNTLVAGTRAGYPEWLKAIHEQSHGNADLVSHFYRRAFGLLRRNGVQGLVATKTIAQGDTRATGLRWICTHGGTIYAATKRVKWPAPGAAVVVSIVHLANGPAPMPPQLDGRFVPRITAFLFTDGGDEDPAPLRANAGKSFQGSIILGMGFTFDDADKDGVALPLSDMRALLAKDPTNQERIFPFIGYAEVATSPVHSPRRYVINFGDMTEVEARKWPDLLKVLAERVKPERLRHTENAIGRRRATYWWQYGSPAKELYAAISGMQRVLVAGSQASAHHALAFLPCGMVYSSNLSVLAVESYAGFATLQCRVHEEWARAFMSTLEDRLAYTPTTCFETFPFAAEWDESKRLQDVGSAYYAHRAAVMVRNNEGLTKTYNRFHDPDERAPDILRLRELHEAMDRAVLDAYGWPDIHPKCDFVLDYEEDDDADDDGGQKKAKKKPWRYRWPDGIRDEVLARLLALNQKLARTGRS